MDNISFLDELLKTLIKKKIIRQAITIPYLIGSHKVIQNDNTCVNEDYIISTLNNIMNSTSQGYWIYTCDNIVQDLVISSINRTHDTDIFNSANYRHLNDSFGTPKIYFEKDFPVIEMTTQNISRFFWDRYKVNFEHMKYSYNYDLGIWDHIPDSEILIIKEFTENCKINF